MRRAVPAKEADDGTGRLAGDFMTCHRVDFVLGSGGFQTQQSPVVQHAPQTFLPFGPRFPVVASFRLRESGHI